MRSAQGLSGRSASGTWIAKVEGREVGPFDGKGPAQAFRSALRKVRPGVKVEVVRLWSAKEILDAAAR